MARKCGNGCRGLAGAGVARGLVADVMGTEGRRGVGRARCWRRTSARSCCSRTCWTCWASERAVEVEAVARDGSLVARCGYAWQGEGGAGGRRRWGSEGDGGRNCALYEVARRSSAHGGVFGRVQAADLLLTLAQAERLVRTPADVVEQQLERLPTRMDDGANEVGGSDEPL
jgi:hypothetical protein